MQISRARKEGTQRLNQRDPQYPPDSYFIKSNEHYLTRYLDSKSQRRKLLDTASTGYIQRYRLFQMEAKDLETLREKKEPHFPHDPRDPFYNPKNYQRTYEGVLDTETIVEKL